MGTATRRAPGPRLVRWQLDPRRLVSFGHVSNAGPGATVGVMDTRVPSTGATTHSGPGNEAHQAGQRLPRGSLAGGRPLRKYEGMDLWRGALPQQPLLSREAPRPQETCHVPVMTTPLRILTRTVQCRRTPLPKVSPFVYGVQPTTAPPKAPPNTFPFGERRPGRHNPTKTTL